MYHIYDSHVLIAINYIKHHLNIFYMYSAVYVSTSIMKYY